MPEMGEYVVGAYLKVIEKCDFVDYGVRSPDGGIKGLGELDVVGLRLADQTAFICEVTTHLGGLEYGSGYADTIAKIQQKFQRQKAYATEQLASFKKHQFMLWSPSVPEGFLTKGLEAIQGLDLVLNTAYTSAIDELRAEARRTIRDAGNPFFRSLQILEHLRH